MLGDLELEMTVHTFSVAQVAGKSVSKPLRSQMHQQGALGVRQACHEPDWRPVFKDSGICVLTNTFAYEWPPPPRVEHEHTLCHEIKGWNETPSPEDCIDVSGLDDFRHLLDEECVVQCSGGLRVPTEHDATRNQLSILNVVPKPHFLSTAFDQELSEPSELFYDPQQCMPIPLFSGSSPAECLGSAWARCAWIVVLHGHLPFQECSSGVVLTPGADITQSNAGPSTHGPLSILWTHTSIHDLWAFLRILLDSGRFGSMSIAFHTPPDISNGVNGIHHIKIYHDARYSLQIRKALDLWCTEPGTFNPKVQKKKMRPLKGGRLLLIDHRNRPVLHC